MVAKKKIRSTPLKPLPPTKKQMSSGCVLAALRNGPMRENAHAWLYEVRNRTGYGGSERYADALVVSLWPSRGIWFAGVEVKTSRQDWLRELDDPKKSAAIQKFCHYWWVASPAGVIELGEVPETWGFYEVKGEGRKRRVHTRRPAPKLDPEPPSATFVASVFRNAGVSQQAAKQLGYQEGYADASAKVDESELDELREKVRAEQDRANKLQWNRNDLAREHELLKQAVRQFERESGIGDGALSRNRGPYANVGYNYKAAQALSEMGAQRLAKRLREAADALEELPNVEHGEVVVPNQAMTCPCGSTVVSGQCMSRCDLRGSANA